MKWTTIEDRLVRHIWVSEDGEEVIVDPTAYADIGTPIDENGNDMSYVRTEILI